MKRYVSCELPPHEAAEFKKYLTGQDVIFETSECFNLIHFSVLADEEEIQKANDFIDRTAQTKPLTWVPTPV